MKAKSFILAVGLLAITVIAFCWVMGKNASSVVVTDSLPATRTAAKALPATTQIDLAGLPVPVVAGGLYDRFRSNPPLSVIAAESPETDLSWFKTLKKTKLDVGFETWSPNFYYENSKTTAIFTADLERLRSLMPASVLAQVQPLQVAPGRGLVALTGYAYHYCDNDSYNEIGLSIVTNKPGSRNFGPISLLGQSADQDFWGYVLKLPVDTELARARGVVGYNLPKWLTPIHYSQDAQSVSFEIVDAATGKPDVLFRTQKLADVSTTPVLVNNGFTNLNAAGELTVGHSQTRNLRHASTGDDAAVELVLSNGSLSTFIKSLDLGEMLRYEYVPDFQMALYAPESLQTFLGKP